MRQAPSSTTSVATSSRSSQRSARTAVPSAAAAPSSRSPDPAPSKPKKEWGACGGGGEPPALVIAPEHPREGYDPGRFGRWIDADGDGCDTRHEVLIAEAITPPVIGAGCRLSGGRWESRYDGAVTTGSGRAFDIDHLIPLAEAWDSGAWAWTPEQRRAFANDQDRPDALIAVSASSNRFKGTCDPAEWLPARDVC